MNHRELWQPLVAEYGEGEAKAIVRLLLERGFGLSLADVLTGGVEGLPEDRACLLRGMAARLAAGEPVQYVLGEAEFDGRWLRVTPSVLIPRPETEELCQWVVASDLPAKARILDIGTGSGCIACTLAAHLEDAEVTGWDLSDEALEVARENARRTCTNVAFARRDALALPADHALWDAIVSNPPYICQRERASMERHVLDHEPAMALFVPDDDALCFYESIARYAQTALKPGGQLFFEINPRYAQALCALLSDLAFEAVGIRDDGFGKQRFIRAVQP